MANLELKFSLAMADKGAELPKFETFEAFENVLKTEGQAIAKAGRGYFSGLAAFATAFAMSHDTVISTAKVFETIEDTLGELSPGNRTKLQWAVNEARKALKGDIDAATDDADAIAVAVAHFQGFPIFTAYNARNEAKAKVEPKTVADAKADDTDQTDKGVKPASDMTADEALAVMVQAYQRLLTLQQGGDTLAETHLAGFLNMANGDAAIMAELKAA